MPDRERASSGSPRGSRRRPDVGQQAWRRRPRARSEDAARCARLAVRLRHRAVVERLVEHVVVDARLARDLAQRPARPRRLLDDLARLVVADVRVERRRGRERQLGVALALLAVRLDPVDALLGEQPRRGREQPDRVEQVPRHQRDEDVQLEVALHAADRDRRVVADHLRRDLRHDLGDDRVDLAGHDRGALLELGQEDLGEPGARPGAHEAEVVRDLRQRDGDRLERARGLDEPVARGLRLERIGRRR